MMVPSICDLVNWCPGPWREAPPSYRDWPIIHQHGLCIGSGNPMACLGFAIGMLDIWYTHTYIYNILMYIYINNILYYKYILLYMYTLPVLLSSHFAGCIRIFMALFFSCSSRSPQHKQGSPSFGCQEWLLPVQFRLTRVPEPSRWKHQVLGARIEVQRSSSSTESGYFL